MCQRRLTGRLSYIIKWEFKKFCQSEIVKLYHVYQSCR